MKFRSYILAVVIAAAVFASGQVAPLASSHAPAVKKAPAAPVAQPATAAPKPAVKVNGAVLTDLDVLREMYTIFPYARQHNGGFPKELEPEIRRGAVEMVIFEELLYQEAKRRNIAIPPERLSAAAASFRKQFDKATYDEYLRSECNGSPQVLREKIRRSLLIEKMMKNEVERNAIVDEAAAKVYYDKNSKQFEHGETISIQTISILPPNNATPAMHEEAKQKIYSAAKLGKAAKTARDFGIIAEQVSDDDWRTKLGDRGTMEITAVPPEVAKAARAMKVGGVSDPIQLGTAWVVIRLNAHTPAGKTPFAQVKAKLISDLRKQKTNEIRAALNRKLRKDAKIEML